MTAPSLTKADPRREAQTSANVYVEIEVGLIGTYVPGYPERGPTYDCGGEPAEPDGFDDVEAVSLTGLRFQGPTTDFLAGIDRSNPEVRKLLDNILTFIGQQEAEEALMQEAA